jgi:hypothetical protein
VTLDVFNVLGQLVSSQALGVQQAGVRSVEFNASGLASGMYTYRLTMGETNAVAVGRMMLLK